MDKTILEIEDDFDVSKYLQAKWRREMRHFDNHRGFNMPIKIFNIEKLTHLDRPNYRVPDVEEKDLMYNPIVVCKMTEEEWAGQRIGNIPFRDRSLKKVDNEGFIWCISRGNQRVSSAIARGYRYIDGYVTEDMTKCAEFGLLLKEEYESLCKEKPDLYRNFTYPTHNEHKLEKVRQNALLNALKT